MSEIASPVQAPPATLRTGAEGPFWYLNHPSRKLPRYLFRQHRLAAPPGSGIVRKMAVAGWNASLGRLTCGEA